MGGMVRDLLDVVLEKLVLERADLGHALLVISTSVDIAIGQGS